MDVRCRDGSSQTAKIHVDRKEVAYKIDGYDAGTNTSEALAGLSLGPFRVLRK